MNGSTQAIFWWLLTQTFMLMFSTGWQVSALHLPHLRVSKIMMASWLLTQSESSSTGIWDFYHSTYSWSSSLGNLCHSLEEMAQGFTNMRLSTAAPRHGFITLAWSIICSHGVSRITVLHQAGTWLTIFSSWYQDYGSLQTTTKVTNGSTYSW